MMTSMDTIFGQQKLIQKIVEQQALNRNSQVVAVCFCVHFTLFAVTANENKVLERKLTLSISE